MAESETFYEVLSVDADADVETIERAYRERVKEYHPDVSDRPDARERFKRITRAKAVLTDRTERRRYDRLGHEAYLRRERTGRTHRSDSEDPAAGSASRSAADSGASSRRSDGAAGSATGTSDQSESHGDATDAADATTADATGGQRTESRSRSGPDGSGRTADTSARTSAGTAKRTSTGRSTVSEAPRATTDTEHTSGRFVVREVVAAPLVALVAVAGVAMALVVRGPTLSTGVLVGSWLLVALVAGWFAARSAPALPDDVVRAHAFPLVVLVGAWYVAIGTRYRLVAVALVAYAVFALLFRTAALASGRGSSMWRAAGVWFAGTLPAPVLLYGRWASGDVAVGAFAVPATGLALPVDASAIVAAGVAVAVVVGHGLWRLGRAVV